MTVKSKDGNATEKPMITLRIEHEIHDYQIWQKAFDSFAEARAKAGVRSFAIRQPVDDRICPGRPSGSVPAGPLITRCRLPGSASSMAGSGSPTLTWTGSWESAVDSGAVAQPDAGLTSRGEGVDPAVG